MYFVLGFLRGLSVLLRERGRARGHPRLFQAHAATEGEPVRAGRHRLGAAEPQHQQHQHARGVRRHLISGAPPGALGQGATLRPHGLAHGAPRPTQPHRQVHQVLRKQFLKFGLGQGVRRIFKGRFLF